MPFEICKKIQPTPLRDDQISLSHFTLPKQGVHDTCHTQIPFSQLNNVHPILILGLTYNIKESKYYLYPIHTDLKTWQNVITLLDQTLQSESVKLSNLIYTLTPYLSENFDYQPPHLNKAFNTNEEILTASPQTLKVNELKQLSIILSAYISNKLYATCQRRFEQKRQSITNENHTKTSYQHTESITELLDSNVVIKKIASSIKLITEQLGNEIIPPLPKNRQINPTKLHPTANQYSVSTIDSQFHQEPIIDLEQILEEGVTSLNDNFLTTLDKNAEELLLRPYKFTHAHFSHAKDNLEEICDNTMGHPLENNIEKNTTWQSTSEPQIYVEPIQSNTITSTIIQEEGYNDITLNVMQDQEILLSQNTTQSIIQPQLDTSSTASDSKEQIIEATPTNTITHELKLTSSKLTLVDTCPVTSMTPINYINNNYNIANELIHTNICNLSIHHIPFIWVTYNLIESKWEATTGCKQNIFIGIAHININSIQKLNDYMDDSPIRNIDECYSILISILQMLSDETLTPRTQVKVEETINFLSQKEANLTALVERWRIIIGITLSNYILQSLNFKSHQRLEHKEKNQSDISIQQAPEREIPFIFTKEELESQLLVINNNITRQSITHILFSVRQKKQQLTSANRVKKITNRPITMSKELLKGKISICEQSLTYDYHIKGHNYETELKLFCQLQEATNASCIKVNSGDDLMHLPCIQIPWSESDNSNTLENAKSWQIIMVHIKKTDQAAIYSILDSLRRQRKSPIHKAQQMLKHFCLDGMQPDSVDNIKHTIEQYKLSVQIQLALNIIKNLTEIKELKKRMRYTDIIDNLNRGSVPKILSALKAMRVSAEHNKKEACAKDTTSTKGTKRKKHPTYQAEKKDDKKDSAKDLDTKRRKKHQHQSKAIPINKMLYKPLFTATAIKTDN